MKINNVTLVLENKIQKNASIFFNNNRIVEIKQTPYIDGIDGQGNIIIPGFIDIHMHGGYGIDFDNLSSQNIKKLINNIYGEGVTNFCIGNVATKVDRLNERLKELETIVSSNENINKSLLGFYMEGPFISKLKKGAHNPENIEKPNIENIKILLEGIDTQYIKYIVYAPEEADDKFVNFVKNKNINLSIGHTNATYYEAYKDFKENKVSHLTHFNNAMTLYNHRQPGVVNFGFLHDDVKCELITDGVHNELSVIKLVYKIKTAQNLIIITDSMNAKGLPNGPYHLGSLNVIKKDNIVTLADNTLAGSSAKYIHCVQTFIKATQCSLLDLNKVTSYNAAKELKLDKEIGLIKEGYIANCVLLDKNDYSVLKTFVNGKIVYEKGGY
ncbi:N-acetylglucosamine-6-phosphate deacetylase [Spiroplasma endosymbiont of Aspidapion aeneum]|uniref:N-acetylglucosamine-6-phosphate deacetylase n=1 Tax=Spiroplasma endosymbiont of Aspidapion aeneum TaxID=3066276 RepID=UPI00313E4957